MSIKYVDQWPRVIGMTANPTAEQCRAAGYELTANKPQDVIDAEQAAIEQAAQAQAEQQAAHDALVEGLRAKYRQTCNGFCQLAGITVVDKFEDESVITAAIEAANTAENYTLALRLTQLAMALQFAITELRRKDGDDAWERI
jgi:hypothetical protein